MTPAAPSTFHSAKSEVTGGSTPVNDAYNGAFAQVLAGTTADRSASNLAAIRADAKTAERVIQAPTAHVRTLPARFPGRDVEEAATKSPSDKADDVSKGAKVQRVRSRAVTAEDAIALLGNIPSVMTPVPIAKAVAAADAVNGCSHAVTNAARTNPATAKTASDDTRGEAGASLDVPATVFEVAVKHQATHFTPVRARSDYQAEAKAPEAIKPDIQKVLSAGRSQVRVETTNPDLARRAVGPRTGSAAALNDLTVGPVANGVALSIGQQISGSIVNEVAAPSEATAFVEVAPTTSWSISAPALRTLSLELSPAMLGPVTLVLSGSGSGLRIRVDAERADTAGLVEHGRDEIMSRLTSAGYSIEELLIGQASDPMRSMIVNDPSSQVTGHVQASMPDGAWANGGPSQQPFEQRDRHREIPRMPERELDRAPDCQERAVGVLSWPRIAGSRSFRSI